MMVDCRCYKHVPDTLHQALCRTAKDFVAAKFVAKRSNAGADSVRLLNRRREGTKNEGFGVGKAFQRFPSGTQTGSSASSAPA